MCDFIDKLFAEFSSIEDPQEFANKVGKDPYYAVLFGLKNSKILTKAKEFLAQYDKKKCQKMFHSFQSNIQK